MVVHLRKHLDGLALRGEAVVDGGQGNLTPVLLEVREADVHEVILATVVYVAVALKLNTQLDKK